MASPQPGRLSIAATPPGSRVLQSPLSDEAIWKRLHDAGFDEESIKRRDKAALIAYIAKLEAEIFDHQHHMGLLILERKEWVSKYEKIKNDAELAEIAHKRDQAAHSSALVEARKREDSLKKALGIEKECIANLEKALHEMRIESAETKVAAEIKLAEARSMVEDAQKRFFEAETKLHAAEALQAEASSFRRTADRKLQEVEAREDDLRRRIISFKSECDVKEKEITVERQSLFERQKNVQQGQQRLLDGQAMLNQREDYIFSRSQELNRLEKELENSKANVEEELRRLNEQKSDLELKIASLTTREEDVIKREALLNKKEHEILILQEKIASKESGEIQKLMADHEIALRTRKSEFEAELETKRKLVEDEVEAKRRASELREVDLSNREDLILEREHELEVQSRALADKERDVTERLNSLEEKEKHLTATEKDVELKKIHLEKEKEEVNKMKLNIEKSLSSLEDEKKQIDHAKERVEAMKSETSELLALEMKLKEEIDMIRAQKLELMAKADEMRAQKTNFEAEWESIDEKREELRNEAEHTAEERLAILKFIKDERDFLKLEKDAMRDQYKHEVESLSREREEFMGKMAHERSEWFSKIQQERADFLLDVEMQKEELENCIEKRREELESYFKEKEKAFEQEKKKELQHISSMKERVAKELEYVASEMKRLDSERMEINSDRERRDREWAELNNSIEELKMQRQKLKKQRELLHADRKEIHAQIEHLKRLEDLKIASENSIALAEMQKSNQELGQRKFYAQKYLQEQNTVHDADLESPQKMNVVNNGSRFNLTTSPNSRSPSSTPFSWIKRCAELIFKPSPEKPSIQYGEKALTSECEDASLISAGKLDLSNGFDMQVHDRNETTHSISERQPVRHALGEPKVILEVPSPGKDVEGLHTLESEIKKDVSENSAHSFSEQGLLAGRKRRVKSSSFNDGVDTVLQQRQQNKKRRQQGDATDSCKFSIQSNVKEGQAISMSLSQTQGGAQETNVLMIDKIINISEVACEDVLTNNFENQAKSDPLPNSVAELEQHIQNRGTDGLGDSGAEHHVLTCDSKSKAHDTVREVLAVDLAQVTENNQPQDQSISEKSDHELQDPDVPKSDNNKICENIGRRTRSKQKS